MLMVIERSIRSVPRACVTLTLSPTLNTSLVVASTIARGAVVVAQFQARRHSAPVGGVTPVTTAVRTTVVPWVLEVAAEAGRRRSPIRRPVQG